MSMARKGGHFDGAFWIRITGGGEEARDSELESIFASSGCRLDTGR